MKTSDFDYDLPLERIAQTPVEPRHASRLLVLNRSSGAIEHRKFWDIGSYLTPGDLLVVNQTRVIPARIFAHKIPGGGKVELLLLKRLDVCEWETLVGGKSVRTGRKLKVEEGPEVEVTQDLEGPRRIIRFSEPIEPYLGQIGHVPLPPYIHSPLMDPERYQTVYASQPGSAAAPTAGLHFTRELMEDLRERGVGFAEVTLHVGLDTFAPVTEDDPQEHQIHTEWCEVTSDAADLISRTRRMGKRVIAVGTTSVRTLESAGRLSKPGERIEPYQGPTDLFILPGYDFRVVDGMITNFHLPKSYSLMLVSAFAGREKILQTYEQAKQAEYRFYSFGDAMLIL